MLKAENTTAKKAKRDQRYEGVTYYVQHMDVIFDYNKKKNCF